MTDLHLKQLLYTNTNETKMSDSQYEIDPESHVTNSLTDNCTYYSEDQFNEVEMNDTFSLIHFNCQSTYTNFSKINDFLLICKSRFKVDSLIRDMDE